MFSWMTIMSFDLCWTFLQAKVPRRSSALAKFLLYSLVGWGSSFLLTILVILTDNLAIFRTFDFIKPRVGEEKCFLQDKAVGIYLHLPSMVVMFVNAILFIVTTWTIYRWDSGYWSTKRNYFDWKVFD